MSERSQHLVQENNMGSISTMFILKARLNLLHRGQLNIQWETGNILVFKNQNATFLANTTNEKRKSLKFRVRKKNSDQTFYINSTLPFADHKLYMGQILRRPHENVRAKLLFELPLTAGAKQLMVSIQAMINWLLTQTK